MTTKTMISLSPIKRSSPRSNSIKKRRLLIHHQQQQIHIYYSIPTLKISYEKQSTLLPDIVNDIVIEQKRKETIINIATILRKVGDQVDEQLQINNTSSSSIDHIFGQRTITFVYCLSHLLRLFL